MNVKAGDLAIITDTPMKGLIVEVIEQSKEFLPHIAWKVKAIGGAVDALVSDDEVNDLIEHREDYEP